MIEALHFLITPLATLLFALWAAWLAFAAESDAEVPRILADQQLPEGRDLPPARALYVAHLALGCRSIATVVKAKNRRKHANLPCG